MIERKKKHVPEALRARRTVATKINDRRMVPSELETGMRRLSENVIENVEYMLDKGSKTWADLAYECGLSPSTVYQVRHRRSNAGTAMVVQLAKRLDVEPEFFFLPHAMFLKLIKKT